MAKTKHLADRQSGVAAIREEIIAEFADQLSAASFWSAINAELKRRVEQDSPREGRLCPSSSARLTRQRAPQQMRSFASVARAI
jgi:hypothetical protein